jgi:hypothetical protein
MSIGATFSKALTYWVRHFELDPMQLHNIMQADDEVVVSEDISHLDVL